MEDRRFRIIAVVTENYNLRCKYCYVPKTSGATMSKEVIDALIRQAELRIDKGIPVTVHIFGGEPLVAKDATKYIAEQVAKLNAKYPGMCVGKIFTNATLLDEEFLLFTKSLGPCISYNFSLDGCGECHDSERVYADGSGSYSDVLKGIEKYAIIYGRDFSKLTGKFMIAPGNVRLLIDSIKQLHDEGKTRIHLGLVKDNVWSPDDVLAYEQFIFDLAQYWIDHVDDGVWYDILAIPILDRDHKKNSYCSAGKTRWSVVPNGDIYPCQRFFNNRSPFKIGTVFEGVDISKGWAAMFANYSIQRNFPKCAKCTCYNFNCPGQCLAAMYEAGGIFTPIPSVCRLLEVTGKAAETVYLALSEHPNYLKAISSENYRSEPSRKEVARHTTAV